MKPVITREHGSWAVLFIPVITGIAVSRQINIPVILLVISIFFLFMSYTPAEMILQNYYRKMPRTSKLKNARLWFTLCFSLSLISGLPLVIFYEKYGLLILAAAALIFFMASMIIMFRFRKNVWSDFLAMTGLTLGAPAIMYLNENAFTSRGFVLWLLNVLFFGSSAFYVHMKMRLSSLKKNNITFDEKLSAGRLNLIYHIAAVALLVIFTLRFPSKEVIVAAYLPMILHAVAGTFKLPRKVSFKKIGIIFLAYSMIFALVLSFSCM